MEYSLEGGIDQAAIRTFDGNHPCKLCNAIQKGRQSGKKQAPQILVKKLNLLCQLGAAFIAASPAFWKLSFSDLSFGTIACKPLLQPPRALLS